MIDFKAMSTPEARELAAQNRAIFQEKLNQENKANRIMADKLYDLMVCGDIEDPYDVDFVKSIHRKMNTVSVLTDKQVNYLEELYHYKY